MIVVYDELFVEHLRGTGHPENGDRVARVAAHLNAAGLFGARESARDATDEELALVHPPAYLERVKRDVANLGPGCVGSLSTGDTDIDGSSLAVARRAAGGAIVAAERAVETDSAVFALVRPPGHHAEGARGMGFCIFSNAALAAHAFARQTGGRALIVDFDYHHGNGTQSVVGGGVSFVSTHAYPAYPGTGSASENVLREDAAIVNLPLPVHAYGTEAFVATWQALLPQVAARVKPDLIIVSAGFDFALGDPVGDLGVDAAVAARSLARTIAETASEYCRGRVAYCLEGGYDPATLARAVEETVRVHDARTQASDRADAGAVPAAQRNVLEKVAAWRT